MVASTSRGRGSTGGSDIVRKVAAAKDVCVARYIYILFLVDRCAGIHCVVLIHIVFCNAISSILARYRRGDGGLYTYVAA